MVTVFQWSYNDKCGKSGGPFFFGFFFAIFSCDLRW